MSDVLLSVPLKSSSEIDIVTPLTAALKVRGYRPLESDWFKEFEKLRNLVVDKNIPKNQPSLETLCRYHDQLVAVQEKGIGNIPNLSLYWESPLEKGFFGGKYYTYAANLELERVAVLFNIAAMQTALATDAKEFRSDESLKNSAKYFQVRFNTYTKTLVLGKGLWKLNGLAGGLAGMVKDVIPKVHGTVQTLGCAVLRRNRCVPDPSVMLDDNEQSSEQHKLSEIPSNSSLTEDDQNISGCGINSPKNSIMTTLSLEKFESRTRNTFGIRIVWDNEKPVTLYQKWNPFDKSIPWITLTSHPLLWHKNKHSTVGSFDIESFSRKLIEILSSSGGESPMCTVEYKPIVIETYVGLTSLLYNANSLGFYKVRGKVSF